ncbi:alpha/beta hydrolase [Polaromonas sp.]|nr:alpha/beta hydrolase [Polaromonas sp.]MDP2451036.1 alpha/beta hydrolase [Polaromonas sp.]
MAPSSPRSPARKNQPEKARQSPHDGPPPSAWLLALELRAFWEFGALLPAWPVLARAPRGDQHSVVVFPGLSASDGSTMPLRRYLDSLGYATSGWEQGFNFGPRAGVLEAARAQVRRAFEGSGRKVSLIGWSLGGVYARELAKELPHMVRSVITLGTPFAGSHRSTHAWRIYELASGRKVARESENYDLPAAPPVPTTSIYSRSDGIVAWQGSIQQSSPDKPQTENVEVVASHVGLGLNPSAWWAVADRLAQPEGRWQPFERKGTFWHGLIYPDPARAA